LASSAGIITLSNTKVSGLLSASGGNGVNGGYGGSIFAATSTLIGNIFANGGNGTINDGGNGGYVSITNTNARGTTASTTISANGGNTASCSAKGGDGGSVDVIDSGYDFISTDAGNGPDANTCPSGSRGGVNGQHHEVGGNVTPEDRQAAAIAAAAAAKALADAEAARLAALAAARNTPSTSRPLDTSGLHPIFTVLPGVTKLYPVTLSPVPTFGDTTSKKAFSFSENLSSFLFAPLPEKVTRTLGKDLTVYLKLAGFSKEQDILTIAKKPLLLPKATTTIPGLFTVGTKGLPIKLPNQDFTTDTTIPVSTYLTSDKKTTLIQKLTTTPHTQLTITLKGGTTGTFNGKTLTFVNSTLTLTTPEKPGIYTLTSPESPLTLLIEVRQTTPIPQASTDTQPQQASWFTRLLNYFF
ncbi:MAG: hypothetical protein WCJ18_11425, partial [Planctomycetota bacterium]